MTTTVESLRRGQLHDAIQDRIKRFIIEHGYRPGDPLPNEAALAGALGISRGSLREAMKSLQTLGVVETRHGFGTFVGRFSLHPLVDGLTFRIRVDRGRMVPAVRELLHVREVLESGLVARVAGSLTGEQLAELEALVAAMEARAARQEMFPEEDRAFHEALYRPLDNQFVVQLLHAFWDVFFAVRTELPGTPPSPTVTALHHRRIVAALAAEDGAAAAAAMALHFSGIQAWLEAPAVAAPTTPPPEVTERRLRSAATAADHALVTTPRTDGE